MLLSISLITDNSLKWRTATLIGHFETNAGYRKQKGTPESLLLLGDKRTRLL